MCQPSSFYTRSKFILWRRNHGVGVWGREVSWHPFLPMVSINFFAFYLASGISTMSAHRTRLTFRVQLQNNSMALLVTEWRKSALRAGSGTIQDAYVLRSFERVWLSSWTWRFFVKLCLACTCQRALLFSNSLWTQHSSFISLFPRLGSFLTQLTTEDRKIRKIGDDQTDSSRGNEKVKNSICEFG